MSTTPGYAPITSFSGPYAWASSFYDAPFWMPDMPDVTARPTREHYFQAAKALNRAGRDWILSAPAPGEAKRRGRQISIPHDWDARKRVVMTQAVLTQFSAPYLPLRSLLAGTGNAVLIEGNSWGDDYWGAILVSPDDFTARLPCMPAWTAGTVLLSGYNWLGRILMMARELLA